MSLVHKFGDNYHKHIFRPIAKSTASITDLTEKALSDAVLGAALFAPEIVAASTGWIIYNSASKGELPHASDFSGIAVVTGVSAVTYFFNLARTPLEEKLNVQPVEKLDEEKEFHYVIAQLNRLSKTQKLSFKEVNDKVNASLDSFVQRVEGYKVKHADKTKSSIFSKQLLRRHCLGIMNPFIQEIVVTSELFPEAIAHEKAHLAGYAREHEAEFAGYLSMLESGEPSLEYLAYRQRLDSLLRNYQSEWGDNSEDPILVTEKTLKGKGLNERTLQEISSRNRVMDEEFSKNSRYLNSINKVSRAARSALLGLFGQGKVDEVYISTPLKLMSAYDSIRNNSNLEKVY